MSLLDTIEIQGIRSIGIGPQNASVIEFLSPLTIICGPNGTGKTTVIEALKYVTTGEVPPGKMQSFIHDLKLANRSRVDASVKLKFTDVTGRNCVVTRRLTSRCDGPKGKISTRSEECTIAIQSIEDGDWKSLSSKIIDSKKEILNLMGVPISILEYIVFCHQEESTWPLDEPKKLKERFDEIFQVTGYVKAIDNLKKELKENIHHLHLAEVKIPLLMKLKTDKKKLNDEYDELCWKIEQNEKEVMEKGKILDELKIVLTTVMENLSSAEKAEREHACLQKEKEILSEQMRLSTVPHYMGEISELESELENIVRSEDFINSKMDRDRLRLKYDDYSTHVSMKLLEKEEITDALNQLKATEILRARLKTEKTALLEEMRPKFAYKDDHVEDFLRVDVEKCKKRIALLQEEADQQVATFQCNFDQISSDLGHLNGCISMKDSERKKLMYEIDSIKLQLLELTQSTELYPNMEDIEKKIQALELDFGNNYDSEELESNLMALKKNRDEIQSKHELIEKKIREKEQTEEIENRIARRSDDLKKYENDWKVLMEKHKEALYEIYGGDSVEGPVSERLSIYMRKLSNRLSSALEEVQINEKELNQAKHKIQQLTYEIDQTSEAIVANESKISKVLLADDDLDARLAEVRESLKSSRRKLGLVNGCQHLFEQWQKETTENRCCPLCDRSYHSVSDVKTLSDKINQKLENLPSEFANLEKEVERQEILQGELMTVAPYLRLTKQLREKKVDFENDLKKTVDKAKLIEQELAAAESEKEIQQRKQNIIRHVLSDASLMDNFWRSINDANRDIKLLMAELGFENSVERKSANLLDLRGDLNDNECLFKSLSSEIDRIQEKMLQNNQIVSQLNTLRGQRLTIGEKTSKKSNLVRMLEEKQIEIEEQVHEMNSLKQKLPSLEANKEKAIDERQNAMKRSKIEIERVIATKTDLEELQAKLSSVNKRLLEIGDCSGGVGDIQVRLQKIAQEIDTTNEAIRSLNSEMDTINAKEERIRRLNEQLRICEIKKRINEINVEQEKITWNGESLSELKAREESMKQGRTMALLVIERKKGEMIQLISRKEEVRKSKESKELHKVEGDFSKEVITKIITENIVKDLTTYIRVVDESIVQYHSKKMEEVNEILDSLWEKVYRGNDIERIQIKSENVEEGEKRRSYNYRVVMCCDGFEIDMPGRCSAGQKMLASILIRIALSDVFCDRCSIIALDEPTANLDILKVENLGDMLAEIVEARCSHTKKKFQLIIITHDDRFVEHLRQLCRPEWIYALSKDSSGLSRVKRHRDIDDAITRDT